MWNQRVQARGRTFSKGQAARWFGSGVAGLVIMLTPVALLAAPEDQDIFENFESYTPSTTIGVPFQIGPSGERAEFGGNAFAGSLPALARSGTHAWLVVNAAADGTISFIDFPATEVEFYANVGSNPDDMLIRAFDPVGTQIGSTVVVSSGSGSVLVTFSGTIDHINVTNGAAGDLVSIDDFGYSVGAASPVPLLDLPGITVLLLALALAGGLLLRTVAASSPSGPE